MHVTYQIVLFTAAIIVIASTANDKSIITKGINRRRNHNFIEIWISHFSFNY